MVSKQVAFLVNYVILIELIYTGLCESFFLFFFILLCISRAEYLIMSPAQQPQETLTINELFSFLQAWTCPIASLLVTRTNGPSQMVLRILFSFFDTL